MSDLTAENHPAHDFKTDYCKDDFCSGWTLVHESKDVTDEITEYACDLAETETDDRGRVDWEAVFDRRMEGMHLKDNTRLTLGNEYDTPAQRKIQRVVRDYLKG